MPVLSKANVIELENVTKVYRMGQVMVCDRRQAICKRKEVNAYE